VTLAQPPQLGRDNDFTPSAAARKQEARSYAGLVRLLGRWVAQPDPGGAALPVLLVPGFISGEISLAVLGRHLRRAGHRTFGGGVGANLGCTDAMVDRLLRRVESVAAAEGRRVALVGHSRGGMIVKLAALRRPDLIASIVVLAAPVSGVLSVAAHVRKQLEWLFGLNRRGLASVISADCVTGECATRVAAELAQPFPASVDYTSLYSRNDAIIDWHTCLDPAASCVEVIAGHTGMATDPAVRAVVISRLSPAAAPAR
jgi:pimeloyl-ACP methyl ester carboxylesterase